MARKDTKSADWKALQSEARNPGTTTERLDVLALLASCYPRKSRDEVAQTELKRLIARHPNTSFATLILIARDVPQALLANPLLPLLPLEHPEFVDQFSAFALAEILRSPEAPYSFVVACQNHPRPYVALAARYHVSLTDQLDFATSNWEEAIIEQILQLEIAPAESLFEVVETGELPLAFTERIGLAAVHEPEPPEECRLFVKRQAQAEKLRKRRKAGKAPATPAMPEGGWEKLLERPISELCDLAQESELPADAFRALVRPLLTNRRLMNAHLRLRKHLARNPSCPADVLSLILRHDTAERIAAHPNATLEILQTLARKYRYSEMRTTIVAHPQADAELIETLLDPTAYAKWIGLADASSDEEEKEIHDWQLTSNPHQPFSSPWRRRLARRHPAMVDRPWLLPAEEREDILAEAQQSTRLLGFAVSAALPLDPSVLASLADSSSSMTRLAAALNRKTPKMILLRLSTQDGHQLVRFAARTRLINPNRTLLGL